ncbi:hypothetical protein [Komarekiella delphini-convector]|nr:hypothetical protein [Komarekiella delphini-convector]
MSILSKISNVSEEPSMQKIMQLGSDRLQRGVAHREQPPHHPL